MRLLGRRVEREYQSHAHHPDGGVRTAHLVHDEVRVADDSRRRWKSARRRSRAGLPRPRRASRSWRRRAATRMRSSAKRASAPRRSSTRRSIGRTSSSSRRRAPATQEGQRLVAAAQQQIELEANRAREALRKEVAQLAVSAASKLLEREIDPRDARGPDQQAGDADLEAHGRPTAPSPDPTRAPRSRRRRATSASRRWSDALRRGAAVVQDARVQNLLGNPRVTPAQLAELVIDIAGDSSDEHGQQLRADARGEPAPRLPARDLADRSTS